MGGLSSLLMPVTGHFAAEQVVHNQPAKFAAIEGLFETQTAAPFLIGGWPDEETMTTHYAIEVPMVGSLLAHGDPYAEVTGLEDFDRELWPPVAITHVAYQIMLGCGGLMIFTALIGGVLAIARRGIPDHPLYLPLVIISGPMGMIAIEAGWTVTEVGRQPWVIQGLMKTSDAVTPMPGLVVPFASFSLLYLLLGVVVVVLLRRIILAEADVALESTPQEGSDAI